MNHNMRNLQTQALASTLAFSDSIERAIHDVNHNLAIFERALNGASTSSAYDAAYVEYEAYFEQNVDVLMDMQERLLVIEPKQKLSQGLVKILGLKAIEKSKKLLAEQLAKNKILRKEWNDDYSTSDDTFARYDDPTITCY